MFDIITTVLIICFFFYYYYYYERLKDPALWPRHCLFKPFRGELHEKMIHAEQQRLDDDGR